MEKINITCKTCKKTFSVDRTEEIPDDVISLHCNWCPDCMDDAQEDYQEWYGYEKPKPPIPKNQLRISFNE